MRQRCLIGRLEKQEPYGDGLGTLGAVVLVVEQPVVRRRGGDGVQLLETNRCYSGGTSSGSSWQPESIPITLAAPPTVVFAADWTLKWNRE